MRKWLISVNQRKPRTQNGKAVLRRFMGSLHVIFGAHWDHEPMAIPSPVLRTPSPPAGGWGEGARFMGSLHANSDARWDHEPRAWSADLQVGAFGARLASPSWSSALRFM